MAVRMHFKDNNDITISVKNGTFYTDAILSDFHEFQLYFKFMNDQGEIVNPTSGEIIPEATAHLQDAKVWHDLEGFSSISAKDANTLDIITFEGDIKQARIKLENIVGATKLQAYLLVF